MDTAQLKEIITLLQPLGVAASEAFWVWFVVTQVTEVLGWVIFWAGLITTIWAFFRCWRAYAGLDDGNKQLNAKLNELRSALCLQPNCSDEEVVRVVKANIDDALKYRHQRTRGEK